MAAILTQSRQIGNSQALNENGGIMNPGMNW
jgi:hypothetical protein